MISKETIQEQIALLLREELLFDGEIDFDATIDTLGIDSIQLMQLFVYLEERFEFEFQEEVVVANIQRQSLHKFVDFVYAAVNRARPGG